jgi:ABC-type antimicrobial peptide transport system permease subunit
VASILAAAGVYAVTAFGVASRTRELAIRAALGAGHARNLRSVLQDLARPIALGLTVGGILIGLATPLLRSVLFGVERVGATEVIVVSVGMLAVALAAALLGAVRMRVIDPIVALRE